MKLQITFHIRQLTSPKVMALLNLFYKQAYQHTSNFRIAYVIAQSTHNVVETCSNYCSTLNPDLNALNLKLFLKM